MEREREREGEKGMVDRLVGPQFVAVFFLEFWSNPSAGTIKGTISKEQLLDKNRLQRLATIRWLFVWGKETTFKDFWGEPILIVEIFNTFLLIFQLMKVQVPQRRRNVFLFFFTFHEPQPFF